MRHRGLALEHRRSSPRTALWRVGLVAAVFAGCSGNGAGGGGAGGGTAGTGGGSGGGTSGTGGGSGGGTCQPPDEGTVGMTNAIVIEQDCVSRAGCQTYLGAGFTDGGTLSGAAHCTQSIV